MAKRNKNIVLKDIELQPQVIGHTYKKKSNLLRVIFIFVVFISVVYFIDDVSVFINNLLGKPTASTIEENSQNNNLNFPNNSQTENPKYYDFSNDLSITSNNLIYNNFNYNSSILTFDVNNTTSNVVNYENKKVFVETYNNDTLVDRFKMDIKMVNANSKLSLTFNAANTFNKIAIVEKTPDDYPDVNLTFDENGESILSCTKDREKVNYTFTSNGLKTINHTVSNTLNDANYNVELNVYQNLVNSYNNLSGINASLNTNEQGFTMLITINLENANLANTESKYYYAYKEQAKVVDFEMITYGFTCN